MPGQKIRCKKCGDVIQSMHRHDFKWCKCKAIFVDGGSDYLRMGGDLEQIEQLELEKEPDGEAGADS